jgi:hypothetical protein
LLFVTFATISFLIAVLSLQLLNIKGHIVHVQSQLKRIQIEHDREI